MTDLADMHGLMVIEFDREQLAAVAAQVKAAAPTTRTTISPPAAARSVQ